MAKQELNHKWYVLSARVGHEKKVAQQIEIRAKVNNLEDRIVKVLVPTQEKIVAKDGKKKTIQDKMYHGYVLVQMHLDDDTWHVVRNTDGVTGFVGSAKTPTPLSDKEVAAILALSEVQQTTFQTPFRVGEAVKVVRDEFKDFIGTIKEINPDKGQLTLMITMFGREVPLSLGFEEVTHI